MERRHIPIAVKVLAAREQIDEITGMWPAPREKGESLTAYFENVLRPLLEQFLGSPLQLDHDPALGLRKRKKNGNYVPDEHDPHFLRFRQVDDHLQKTVGRKPGAERTVTTKGSDIWLMKKFRKLERPPKRKQKIPVRKNPWPKRRFGR